MTIKFDAVYVSPTAPRANLWISEVPIIRVLSERAQSGSLSQQDAMAELGSPDGPDDMAEVLVQMENGSVMSRFYAGRRRPEKKTVVLKQGVFEIAWYGGVRQGRTSTAVPEGTGRAKLRNANIPQSLSSWQTNRGPVQYFLPGTRNVTL